MKKYLIQFFYYTDNRWEVEINANNEIEALILAQNSIASIRDWSDNGKGFFVKISLVQ